jgi:hypothetical protein
MFLIPPYALLLLLCSIVWELQQRQVKAWSHLHGCKVPFGSKIKLATEKIQKEQLNVALHICAERRGEALVHVIVSPGDCCECRPCQFS